MSMMMCVHVCMCMDVCAVKRQHSTAEQCHVQCAGGGFSPLAHPIFLWALRARKILKKKPHRQVMGVWGR